MKYICEPALQTGSGTSRDCLSVLVRQRAWGCLTENWDRSPSSGEKGVDARRPVELRQACSTAQGERLRVETEGFATSAILSASWARPQGTSLQ